MGRGFKENSVNNCDREKYDKGYNSIDWGRKDGRLEQSDKDNEEVKDISKDNDRQTKRDSEDNRKV